MTSGPGTDSAWRPPDPARAAGGAEHVDGYADLVEVGRGGDSIVYRARDLSMRRDVAIKVLLVDDETRAQRFAREVEITVDLGRQHPNIVTLLAVATTRSGRPAIVMDFHELGTLHDRLSSHGPMPAEEVVRVGEVLADALAFAHERGVLHRDVKPQNVLALPTSWVLADFGIARLADSAHTSSAETFTYRHAAPQILDGYPPTAADDVWSLGSTLYTLLDGRPPFASDDPHDDSALAYLRRARTEPHRPLVVPGGERIRPVIDRCLEKRVEDRWASAADLRDALAALRGSAWEPAGDPGRLPEAPGALLGHPERPPATGPADPVAHTPTGNESWQPAAAAASGPPADPDVTAVRRPAHRQEPPAPPVPAAPLSIASVASVASAPVPVEPAPVALSVAGRAPEAADAEATGLGYATGGIDATGGRVVDTDDVPRRSRRLPLILLVTALVVGLVLGLGGAVLRRAGNDTPTSAVTPTVGAEALPTLASEPTDAPPLRDRPAADLAFVFSDIEARPDGLFVAWDPVDDADIDYYLAYKLEKDVSIPVARIPAESRESLLPFTPPIGRSCYVLVVFLIDGTYGNSNRRCVTR